MGVRTAKEMADAIALVDYGAGNLHSVAQAAGITLHVQLLYGTNNHHVCEAIFKGFARAMRSAVELDPRKGGAIPSTKGQLGG